MEPDPMWWKDPITLATIVIAGATVFNLVVSALLWVATYRNARIARLVFEASERPWLGVNLFKVANNPSGKVLRISLRIENFGKVPALQMKARWEDFRIGDLRAVMEERSPASEETVVFPGVGIGKTASIKGKTYDALSEKVAKLQLSLLITYEGPRRDKYWTKQTYLFDPKAGSFVSLKGEVGKDSPS